MLNKRNIEEKERESWYRINKLFEFFGNRTFSKKIRVILFSVVIVSFLLGITIFIFMEAQRQTREAEENLKYLLDKKYVFLQREIKDIEDKAKVALTSYIKGESKDIKYFTLLNIYSIYMTEKDKFLIKKFPKIDKSVFNNFRRASYFILNLKGKKFLVINIKSLGKYFVFVKFENFLKMANIGVDFLPSLELPVSFDISPHKIYKEGAICKNKKIENTNLYLNACVEKSKIVGAVIIDTILKGVFILVILIILMEIIYRNMFEKLVTYPTSYLKKRIQDMKKNLEYTSFDLHRYTEDEFGEISKALEDAREKILSEKKKLVLVKETTTKMYSFSSDLHQFALFVANNLDKLLGSEGSAIWLYSKSENRTDLKVHSDKFISNNFRESILESKKQELLKIHKRNVYKLFNGEIRSIFAVKKEVDSSEDYYLLAFTILPKGKRLESEDMHYIDAILSHLIYNIHLLSLATVDPLTKLYNRRFIVSFAETEVKEALRYKRPLSIILLDIDNFKGVNDTYGHPVGDEVIKMVADVLKTEIRETDKAGRYGGEEFIIILPNTPAENALEVAERVRKAIESRKVPVETEGEKIELKVTASIGVSSLGTHGNTFFELLQAADIALYKAKKEGKNQVQILEVEDIKKILQEEFEDKKFIEDAIEQGKVIPYFQPILDINTLDVIGYEVLARIKYKNEITTADKFIKSSIRFGFADIIDEQVQEKAIELAVKEKMKDKLLFFNLSRGFIENPSKILKFEEYLFKKGFPSDKVVFEITEEEAISEVNVVKEVIRIAKNRKIKFALDDFGVGYSTFTYIKQFDVDIIKLDGSLIKNIDKDKDNQIIVEAIAYICKKKGIKLLAEMVETKEELETLKKLGVDYVQGYYFGKPSSEPNLRQKGNVLYRSKKIF